MQRQSFPSKFADGGSVQDAFPYVRFFAKRVSIEADHIASPEIGQEVGTLFGDIKNESGNRDIRGGRCELRRV